MTKCRVKNRITTKQLTMSSIRAMIQFICTFWKWDN